MALALEGIRVGIVFNALVSGIVALISLAFSFFLFARWRKLDTSLRAYTWFWVMTMFVWMFSAARYIYIGTGFFDPYSAYDGSLVHIGDVIIQGSVFFTGPPLFYYVAMRVFGEENIASAASITSFILGVGAFWFIVQPQGLSKPMFTYFSADASINTVSLVIFGTQIAILFLMLLYDSISKLRLWRATSDKNLLFYALYSVSLLVYVVLGGIDQSKMILDWPLIVFRTLYGGAFLMAYLTIIQHEAHQEEFLISSEPSS